MELRVKYEDWLVGDGDQPVIVGSPWWVTLELERDGPVTPDDWHPILAPSSAPHSGLWPVDGKPGRHRLVGGVVMDDSFLVGIEAGGWRMAAAGRHSGRVEGQVVLNHDTYFLDDELREFATQPVEIAAIEYVPSRQRRDPRPRPAGPRRTRFRARERFDPLPSFHPVEWGAPVPVTSTHDPVTHRRTSEQELDDGTIEHASGIFVLTCRRPA
jgi:hypothetical protein